jgi:hypothetical protein
VLSPDSTTTVSDLADVRNINFIKTRKECHPSLIQRPSIFSYTVRNTVVASEESILKTSPVIRAMQAVKKQAAPCRTKHQSWKWYMTPNTGLPTITLSLLR